MLTHQTMRVWIPKSCFDLMADIRSKGVDDVVLEAISLEDDHLTAQHGNGIDGRPENTFLVDLAIVRQAISRVRDHYHITPLPLNDLSLVVLNKDSHDPETQA